MCIYLYVSVCIYQYLSVCISIHMCVCVCVYLFMHVCTYIHTYMCGGVHIYIYIYMPQATFNLIVQNWRKAIPQDWIDGILMPFYQSKGEQSVCDNHHGITLLESVGKVLARVLLIQLQEEIFPVVVSES